MNLNQAQRILKQLAAAQPDAGPTLEQWRKYRHLPLEEYYKRVGYTPPAGWLEYQKRAKAHIKEMLEGFGESYG